MPNLEFSINIPADPDKLLVIATDYENFYKFFPSQIKSIKIVDRHNNDVTTEEVLFFKTVLKHEIIQKSIHKKIDSNKLSTKIISGPFKNSIIEATYEKIDIGTRISIKLDLKLSLKYKIFYPIIKNVYKAILTGLLYKMGNEVQNL